MDFQNVFAYYDKPKHKEIKCLRKSNLLILYDMMLEYICAKRMYISNVKKMQIYSKKD
jgi:hypothetical protein